MKQASTPAKIALVLRATMRPFIYLRNRGLDSQQKFKFALGVLQYEILPAFDVEDSFIVDLAKTYENDKQSQEDIPSLITEFSEKVVPCIISYYDDNARIPDRLLMSFATMI